MTLAGTFFTVNHMHFNTLMPRGMHTTLFCILLILRGHQPARETHVPDKSGSLFQEHSNGSAIR